MSTAPDKDKPVAPIPPPKPSSAPTESQKAEAIVPTNVTKADSQELQSADEKRREKERDMLLAEWKEIRETLRYFGNKRFAQLTVFIAANGFMINAYFGKENPMPGLWGGLFGMFLSLVFFLHEKSSVAYFKAYALRGVEIENNDLKVVRMMSRRPKGDLGTQVTYALYLITLVVWLAIVAFDLVGIRPQSWNPQWARTAWQQLTGQPAPTQPPRP